MLLIVITYWLGTEMLLLCSGSTCEKPHSNALHSACLMAFGHSGLLILLHMITIAALYKFLCNLLDIYLFQDRFAGVDIRVRVNGGGHVSQIYAIRQAISKALVAYYQKCECFKF